MKPCALRLGVSPLKRLIPACVLVFSVAGMAHAVPLWPPAPYSQYAKDESLQDVLRQFASGFSLGLNVAPGVAGTVNGKFNANTPTEFMDRLGGVYGFNWFVYSGTLFVSPSSALATRAISAMGSSITALREALLQLGVLDTRFGWGELPEQGIALVSGPPAYVDMIQRTVAALPLGTGGQQVAVFRLKHASVNDRTVSYRSQNVVTPGLATVLRNLILGSGAGANSETLASVAAPLRDNPPVFAGMMGETSASSIGAVPASEATGSAVAGRRPSAGLRLREPTVQADHRLNAIIVQDIPDRIPVYKQLIEQLDVPSTLIEIEAMIVDVNSSNVSELGVAWGARAGTSTFGYGGVSSNTSNTLPDSSLSMAPGTLGLSVSNVLAARLRALQDRGQANVLSQPSILTADNLGALIDQSETIYLQTTSERAATVTQIPVGTSLRVTPRYIEGSDGRREVELTVDIEDGTIEADGSGNTTARVRKSNISTLAIVGDGETLLVAGHNKSEDGQNSQKVPILGDIPLIGTLFSYKKQNTSRRERLFLLRPRVVSIQGQPVKPPRQQSADTGPALSATWRGENRPMTAGQYLDLIQGQQTRVRFDAVKEAAVTEPVRAGETYINSLALGEVSVPRGKGTAVRNKSTVHVQTRQVNP